jgi:hypothetical protein
MEYPMQDTGLLDPYLTLKKLCQYSCISVRTLRKHLNQPTNPLPHYQVTGKILVRRSEFDAWLCQYRRGSQPIDLDAIVDEMLSGL